MDADRAGPINNYVIIVYGACSVIVCHIMSPLPLNKEKRERHNEVVGLVQKQTCSAAGDERLWYSIDAQWVTVKTPNYMQVIQYLLLQQQHACR